MLIISGLNDGFAVPSIFNLQTVTIRTAGLCQSFVLNFFAVAGTGQRTHKSNITKATVVELCSPAE